MKNVILPILLFVLGLSATVAQNVPEKAGSIVITMPDSSGLKEKITKVIADKDYTVASGKSAAIITTAAKTLKNGTRVLYNFQMKGADIILTGALPVAGQSAMKIAYQGKKGTAIMNGWEEMEKIAKAFGGSISYK